MIVKLILICLSNSFFNFFIKMKNEKRTGFRFPFFYENEIRMKVLKIQRKNLLNIKMVVSYLNFVFFIKVKAKSKYKILNFVFQFIKKNETALWVYGLCPYSELFWSVFSHIRTEYSFQMREYTEQNNSEYGRFLRSDPINCNIKDITFFVIKLLKNRKIIFTII